MKKLKIELADTPSKRELGLMGRKKLAQNNGMLFKFPESNVLSFWMKNTYIPLDIAFIDEKGTITQIESMAPLSTRSIRSNKPCKYALEVNKNWFRENDVDIGFSIVGEGVTHRNKREITAQGGFIKTIKDLLSRPFKKKEEPKKEEVKPKETPKVEAIPEKVEEQPKELTPPEQQPEGGQYPQSLYLEKYDEEMADKVDWLRDLRGRIRFADEFNLKMEIIYWTLNGHILPPRKVMPLPGEGYVVKSGPNGEFLVAFDMSSNISGGDGWTIKGNQPKSFLLDNIVNLIVLDYNDQEINPNKLNEFRERSRQEVDRLM
jgi:uncharacterized membrane protein (UPF0127 family)